MKLMPDFWDDRNGYNKINETGEFYQRIQRALSHVIAEEYGSM